MYDTVAIAELLDVPRQNVNYYIRKGYLNALLVDGNYEITHNDYISFRDEYFDTDKRNSSRGIQKKLTDEQVDLLSHIILDTKNNDLSFKEFKTKYQQKTDLIPQMKEFIIYKRDKCIVHDNNEKNIKYANLAEIYGLSIRGIEDVINKTKERSDF